MADEHDAVLTNPWSRVTYPVSFSRALTSMPPGPSTASRTGIDSWPPGWSSLTSVMYFPRFTGRCPMNFKFTVNPQAEWVISRPPAEGLITKVAGSHRYCSVDDSGGGAHAEPE